MMMFSSPWIGKESRFQARRSPARRARRGHTDARTRLTRLAGAVMLAATVLLSGPASGLAKSKTDKKKEPPKLLRDSVMQVNQDYIIWSVDGTTRVNRDRFRIPEKMWVRGKLQPTPDQATVPVAQVRRPMKRVIDVAAAGAEVEGFQVVVTPRRGDLKIGEAQVSDLKGEQGTLPSKDVSVHLMGYLWGTNPLSRGYWHLKPGETIGPFADVLLPEGSQTTAKKGRNYALYFKVHVPPKTPRGDYSGQVTLPIDGQAVKLPVKLHVWGYTLPHQTAVDTQLFSLDHRSLEYWYGLAPWEDQYKKVASRFLENLAAHRFSPSTTPPKTLRRTNWRKFPAQVKGKSGKAMDFKDGRRLWLGGAKFDEMEDGFTVGFWLKTQQKDIGGLLDQNYRHSGYALHLTDGKLRGVIGLGTLPSGKPWPRHHKPPAEKLRRTVQADYPSDGQWHDVAFSYQPGKLTLFIDGRQAANKSIDQKMSPSYIIPHLSGAHFQVDELRWSDQALSADQVREQMNSSGAADGQLAAYSFDGPTFDFASKVEHDDTTDMDRQYLLKRARWVGEHGLYLNDIGEKPGAHADIEEFKRYNRLYWRPLRERGLLATAYARLPHDESLDKTNRDWAKLLDQVAPEIARHATIGGMGGGRRSTQEKLEQLNTASQFVDTWASRMSIINHFWGRFFKEQVAKGKNISPYIHDANIVETRADPMAGRIFFWKMFKRGFSACTLWNTSLWFQAVKKGGHRAEKKTWRVPWGFKTTKRNVSIDGGMIFYPGKDGPINSMRAEAWRDGIEDYDSFALLRSLIDKARKTGRDAAAVRMGAAVLAQVNATQQADKRWRHALTGDTARVHHVREMAARAIERLEGEQPAPTP